MYSPHELKHFLGFFTSWIRIRTQEDFLNADLCGSGSATLSNYLPFDPITCHCSKYLTPAPVTCHLSWACVPEMLSRLASVRIFQTASRHRAGFPPKNSRTLAFASSPIASAFLLCVIFAPLDFLTLFSRHWLVNHVLQRVLNFPYLVSDGEESDKRQNIYLER